MVFTLCPDDGPPRLWRFVAPGELGLSKAGNPIVAVLLDGNILKIDRELFNKMGWIDQHLVLRTQRPFELA